MYLTLLKKKWHIANIQEKVQTVSSCRTLSIFASGAIILLKLVQLFSLWRLAITEKVKRINPMKRRRSKNSFYENFINSPYHRDSVNTDKKSYSFPIINEV